MKRHELEEYVEERLKAIADALVAGDSELVSAFDYHPSFFGGRFPALGVSVGSTRGSVGMQDRPDRPREISAEVHVYEPCIPVRGAYSFDEDKTSRAKRLTRRIRGEFLTAVFDDAALSPFVEVSESRGGDRDEVGMSNTDGAEGRDILWIDRTDLVIKPQ